MKNKNWFGAVFLIVPLGLLPEIASAQPDLPTRDFGREVLGVFAAKCADCHGADLPKPKGRFGYILDLEQVAGNTEIVIPPKPEESELWALVSHDEMPPPDSPRGGLTPKEKEIVRAWIGRRHFRFIEKAREKAQQFFWPCCEGFLPLAQICL